MNRRQRNAKALNNMMNNNKQNIQKRTTNIVIDELMAAFIISLNTEYGFGAKRMERLMVRVAAQFECMEAGTVTMDDIKEWCKEKKFDYNLFFLTNNN